LSVDGTQEGMDLEVSDDCLDLLGMCKAIVLIAYDQKKIV